MLKIANRKIKTRNMRVPTAFHTVIKTFAAANDQPMTQYMQEIASKNKKIGGFIELKIKNMFEE